MPGMIAEALRGEDTGCSGEEYRHKMTNDEAQPCHWTPHSYKKISNYFLLNRNTDLELDQTMFLWMTEQRISF